MAHKQPSRVGETSTSTGTGAMTLAGAISGLQAFSAELANGDTVDILIVMGSDWEISRATFASGGNTLTRSTVLASTNSDNAVNWGAGTKTIKAIAVGLSNQDSTGLANLRTLLGLGTGNSPQFTGVNIGHASDTTVTRESAGHLAVEGNKVWDAGNDGAGSGLDADLLDGKNIGTSGNVVPLLDGNNTHSGTNEFTGNLKASALFGVGSAVTHTIASGAITVTASHVRLDTEGAAATDDLDTINGGSEGDIIVLSTTISTRDVVVKDSGSIRLAGSADITLDHSDDRLMLMKVSTVWVQIAAFSNVS